MSAPSKPKRHPLLIPALLSLCLGIGGAGSILGGALGVTLSLVALAPVLAIVWSFHRAGSK